MEEKIRFRNHISIIVERAGAGFWVLMGILFWQFIDDPEMIQEISQTEDGLFWLLVGLGLFLAVKYTSGKDALAESTSRYCPLPVFMVSKSSSVSGWAIL